MVESEQDGSSMLTSDDPSAMEAELWRHLREGVMPGRLDERLLFALWRSLHSFVHWHDDPRDAADRRLAGSWFGMLLSSVDRKNADLSDAQWDRLLRAARSAVAVEIRGCVGGRRGVAGADEWVLVQVLNELAAVNAAKPERQ